mmetsp:Transcript_34816/g.64944  ORF Transcript_34816/g.64944 Transcript_34816/m.64944 type:complete len:497 (-) Transcript_34816:163-1653(-)
MPTGLNDSMKKSSVSAPVSVASSNAVVNFLKDLDKIQEQQMHYSKKIEKEKRRKTQLDEDIKIMKEDILAMKSKTRDGQLYRDEEAAAKKTIARLEKKMQLTRIQLSVAHSENSDMRKSIDAMRLNKTMYLQIRNDMVTELAETKKKIIAAQKENISINNKKLKAKSDKTNIKNQMISDMEEFSREMQVAKENISSNQETVIEAIREKMTSQFVDEWDEFEGENTSATNHTAPSEFRETLAATISRSDEDEIRALLKATNLTSVDELLGNMQQCEDSIFSMYKNIQLSGEELEKLELENKILESQAEEQVQKLQTVEGHNDKVREDLEQHISAIQKSVAYYENGYNSNMGVLSAIVESLTSILKHVALDEDVAGQQLISQGVNDRNIEAYLGVVEQRIDDLIQISKAAQRESFTGTDFHAPIKEKKPVVLHVPHLPTLHSADNNDEAEDNEDENLATRVQPVNIALLKDFMHKKIQKGIHDKKITNFVDQKQHSTI